MTNWLKRWLARKELAELDRWRQLNSEYRKWLSEFNDITLVLDSIEKEATGTEAFFISDIREKLRSKRHPTVLD